jgi:hypothetical protein
VEQTEKKASKITAAGRRGRTGSQLASTSEDGLGNTGGGSISSAKLG